MESIAERLELVAESYDGDQQLVPNVIADYALEHERAIVSVGPVRT